MHSTLVPQYNWFGEKDDSKSISININNKFSKNLIALVSDRDIEPIFKKSSIFIIDRDVTPTNNNIIGIKLDPNGVILIRKLNINNQKKSITLFDNKSEELDLLSTRYYDIIGVIVQIVAKT